MSRSRRQFLTASAAFAAGTVAISGVADAATAPHVVTLLNGKGVPGKHLGVVGDFYIDDRSHAIYGPRRTSGWGQPVSLIGPRGPQGSAGANGSGGSTAEGPQGPQGPQGATGSQGSTGATGPQGYSVLSGATPPAQSDGEDNDFYIDTATTQLYGPKEGGVWGSPISLTGGEATITVIDGGSL